jgi:hypothetical protein
MGTQKDKKDKKDKKKEMNKNAKLQLKGRIFMTNVTEVLSLGKQGNALRFLVEGARLTNRQVPTQYRFSGRETLVWKTSSSDFLTRRL